MLATVSLIAAMLPYLSQYLTGEFGRRVGLLAQEKLYVSVNKMVGLNRFEDPKSLDKLRLAQRCGQETPAQLLAASLALMRTAATSVGFLVSLAVISPPMTALVLVASLPAVAIEFRLARARASVDFKSNSMERREAFYGGLLTGVGAAKEV